MTHQFENITTALIIVIIGLIPVVIMYKNKLQKERRNKERLNTILMPFEGRVNEFDSFRYYAIGIDYKNGLVSYTNYSSLQRVETGFKLKDIKQCNVRNITRQYTQNAISTKVIDRLELILTPIDQESNTIVLEFYDSKTSSQPINELKLIEKWEDIIKRHL